jgi:uncharacterized protein (TIGR03000 family)
MLRTSFLVAAACAAMSAVPDTAQAQRRGWGGYGRGGYYGGSGISIGIGNYGYGYGNYGGYRGYGYGYRPYYSNYGYGYSPYYSGYYNSYPSTVYYNTYPSTVYTYPSNTYSAYPSGTIVQQPIAGNTTSFYGGGQMAANQVTVRVILPTPDAQLMVQDQMNQASGNERIIVSPALQPDTNYHYTFKATWRDQNGQEVTREKHIDVKAGQQYTVDFNQQ